MAKPQDVLKSLSQIGHRIGENIEKTCQFGLTDPEGPKDRDLDPGLKLVWSISTKARAHASSDYLPDSARAAAIRADSAHQLGNIVELQK